MTIYSFRKIQESPKSAHQSVEIDDQPAGEVWREQVFVPDNKGRQTKKWRWFSRRNGEGTVIGKGNRAAVIFGAGFPTKHAAAEKLRLDATSAVQASSSSIADSVK